MIQGHFTGSDCSTFIYYIAKQMALSMGYVVTRMFLSDEEILFETHRNGIWACLKNCVPAYPQNSLDLISN